MFFLKTIFTSLFELLYIGGLRPRAPEEVDGRLGSGGGGALAAETGTGCTRLVFPLLIGLKTPR